MNFRVGDLVEIRKKNEILKSLDKNGCLEGLPFMPQMFQYCGEVHAIFKRAHKTCDTVNRTGGRKISDCVHLELRCDGEVFGDCQAACLIFWKTAWLKGVNTNSKSVASPIASRVKGDENLPELECCTESHVLFSAHNAINENNEVRYVCQATQLPYFTSPLPWWDISQYVEDYKSGNVSFRRLAAGLVYALFYTTYRSIRKIRGGYALLRVYDWIQAFWGGIPYPRWVGSIPPGHSTPINTLDLQPGELVQVKSYKEILGTLDTGNKNRGLYFDAEMVPYCGGTFKVKKRVSTFIDEKSGKTITMKTPAIILEDVWCQARYSDCRMFCPRCIYSWWREIWLKRVSERCDS